MNKICTSLEQSRKLIELGIDANAADMCWTNHLFNAFLSSWRIESTTPQEYKNLLDRFVVKGYLIEPTWSLSALMDLMPKNYVVEKCSDSYCCYNLTVKEFFANDAVDAAFKMVCWLKENENI